MELPNGEVLMHAGRPYDPKKAHDYYIRTRHLKGRKKGQVDPKVAELAKRLAGKSDEHIQGEIAKSTSPAEKKLMQIMLANRQKAQGKSAKPKATPEEKQAAAKRVQSLQTKLSEFEQETEGRLG